MLNIEDAGLSWETGLHSGGGEARRCLCNAVMVTSVGHVGRVGRIGRMGHVGHVGRVGEESMGRVGEAHGARWRGAHGTHGRGERGQLQEERLEVVHPFSECDRPPLKGESDVDSEINVMNTHFDLV